MVDLSQYEDAATLNRWFQSNYPMGSLRIIDQELHLVKDENGKLLDEIIVVTTACFRDIKDEKPTTMNLARGRQTEYAKHMQRFYAEDVTTSSYARCIALLKATDKTATKEGMVRATAWSVEPKPELDKALEASVVSDVSFVSQRRNTLDDNLLREQYCPTGSRMRFKEGISKTTQKPFRGYVCECGQGCPPIWASLSANGTWYFKEAVSG